MRVACIDPTTNEVINVIEVESLDKVPDIVLVTPDGKIVRKDEVILKPTNTGSVSDLYIEGKGFYRLIE